jgi:hypothetical protein
VTDEKPISGHLCPACEKPVKRKPSRGVINRLKKLFTSKRPHYCRACGWVGWLDVSGQPRPTETWTVEREPPDLGAVDAGMVGDLSPSRANRHEPQS